MPGVSISISLGRKYQMQRCVSESSRFARGSRDSQSLSSLERIAPQETIDELMHNDSFSLDLLNATLVTIIF
jgi:hypothetical protein